MKAKNPFFVKIKNAYINDICAILGVEKFKKNSILRYLLNDEKVWCNHVKKYFTYKIVCGLNQYKGYVCTIGLEICQ